MQIYLQKSLGKVYFAKKRHLSPCSLCADLTLLLDIQKAVVRIIKGSPQILICGESVEQGVVLYKCMARCRTSLSFSEDYRF